MGTATVPPRGTNCIKGGRVSFRCRFARAIGPGEKLFVDWAGQTIPLVDRDSGEIREAYLFVAVMGASNYTFARAYPSQELPFWIQAHVEAFRFLGGAARSLCRTIPRPV